MRKGFFVLLFILPSICSAPAWAAPDNLQVWFMKEASLRNLRTFIDTIQPPFMLTRKTVENSFECVPMGDGCFHPQLGFMEKKETSDAGETPKEIEGDEKYKEVDTKTFNSDKVQLVECDENNFFDLYCGKAKKRSGSWSAETEIWIDISSSLNLIDPADTKGSCYRKVFVESLVKECGGRDKINIRSYNTNMKEVGMFDSLCLSYGTNNEERLMDWIEKSKAKNLIILTDSSELTMEFSEYLNSVRAITKGADTADLFAADLLDHKAEVLKLCK